MGSSIVIVNDQDQVIGHKAANELASHNIYRVARLIVVNSKGQLLMAQRSFNKKKDPGLWGLAVEGTVEQDESYESNIRKEAEEEIGLKLGVLEPGPTLRMSGKYNHHCQFFIYRTDIDSKQLTLQKDELAAVKWFDVGNLQQEVSAHPEKFGYNFVLILEKILPYIAR